MGQSGALGQTAAARRRCCSGLETSDSSIFVFSVSVGGRKVPIYGRGQETGKDKCPGGVNKHRQESKKIAREAAASGEYEYLTMDRAWSTSTGVSTDTRRPDVIGVRCNGKVDAWEVMSKGDTASKLQDRVDDGMKTLPVANRGETFVVKMKC